MSLIPSNDSIRVPISLPFWATSAALAVPRADDVVRFLFEESALSVRPEHAVGLGIIVVTVFLFCWAVIGAVFLCLLIIAAVIGSDYCDVFLEAIDTWFAGLFSAKFSYCLVTVSCVLGVGWYFNLLAGLCVFSGVAVAREIARQRFFP